MAMDCSVERRRYREGHKRGVRERQLDEEDSYYDRTEHKRKLPVLQESREVLAEKLEYKKKRLAFYEERLRSMEKVEEWERVCGVTGSVKESDDPLDAFMNENKKKMNEMQDAVSIWFSIHV